MLELNTASFYGVTAAMQALGHRIDDGKLKSMEDGPDGGLIITFQNDPFLVDSLKNETEELRINLRTLGARLALMSADKLYDELCGPNGFTWEHVGKQWSDVHFRLLDELTLSKVFVLGPREVDYFAPSTPLFGADYGLKFPTEGAYEVDEAAKCLALARPTAAVFHLMRVMEVGLKAVGLCLGIPNPAKAADRNWGNVLKGIKADLDAHTGSVPTKTWAIPADKEFFERAYASLDAVRVAWRNTTMHVENKYTDDEAEHVFVAVRGLMKELASRMDENGGPKA